MKFLILSDIHGNVENIEKLDSEFKAADAVLFGGDFAKFGAEETGKPVLDALLKKHDSVFSVIGNCDNPDFLEETEKADISVEKNLTFHEGIALCGAGGGTKFSGDTPNERDEDEILSDFDVVESASAQCADEDGHWQNLVLIMHNPPKDTKCDFIPAANLHAGSQKLREYIEKRAPFLVVTGHIHEGTGIDTVGSSVVINPGPLFEGKYAVAEAEKDESGAWKVTKSELRQL